MSDLKQQVEYIVEQIETGVFETEEESPNALDYLDGALDIEYIVTSNKEYRAGRVLVAFGGPNIWINTADRTVEGYWWNEKYIQQYNQDSIGIDEALSTLYNC